MTDKQLIEEVLRQFTDIHSAVDYATPLELYIKRYKFNRYDIEADEKLKTNKSSKI